MLSMLPPLVAILIIFGNTQSVVIDGVFEDWQSTSTQETPWSLCGTGDTASIAVLISRSGPPRVVQQLDEPLTLAFDLDRDVSTGSQSDPTRGRELMITLSPQRDGRKGGVTATLCNPVGFASARSPYDFGFVMAPTTASPTHEIRIDRHLLPEHEGEITCALIQKGKLLGSTTISLPPLRPAKRVAVLPSKPPAGIRVISWNIERGGLIKRAPTVGAILKTLNPDVLLLQELEDGQTSRQVQSMLADYLPGVAWTVAMSPAGSGLRTAVASRLPAVTVPGLQAVRRADRTDRTIRIAGLLIELPHGESMLAASIHLKCCGGLHGPEDMTRISETLSIRESLATAAEVHDPVALVVGGDLNLVASPLPLSILKADGQRMFDPERSDDLEVATALHPDGRSVFTWSDAKSRFTPGRLDFIMTGGEVVQVQAFVFDSSGLAESIPTGLSSEATARASDHLPVVLDLANP